METETEHYADEQDEVTEVSPGFWTVAIYLVDRAYGGPEEGGWWYNTGMRVGEAVTEAGEFDRPAIMHSEHAAQEWAKEANEILNKTVNKGRRPLSSVLCQGIYQAQVHEGWPPGGYPAVRPHYE